MTLKREAPTNSMIVNPSYQCDLSLNLHKPDLVNIDAQSWFLCCCIPSKAKFALFTVGLTREKCVPGPTISAMDKILIGAHVSIAGGVMNVFENAAAIEANFVQIFTRSPRVWKSSLISDDEAFSFKAELASGRSGLRGLVTHAPYLVNLASPDPEILDKSRAVLVENFQSASKLGARGMVVHIGSHKGAGLEASMAGIASSLRLALESVDGPCRILLENTAGQGGSVGVSFDELARIVEALNNDDRIGVCLDTQHLFASGVSYGTIEEADTVVGAIETKLGIARLGCVHLNDSKVSLGTMKDRHENLGQGLIGKEALSNLISHPSLLDVPLVLETPGGGEGPRAMDINTARELLRVGMARRGLEVQL